MSTEILPPDTKPTRGGSRPVQPRVVPSRDAGLPRFANVTREVRDIGMTVDGFIADVRNSGVLERQNISDIPVVTLDDGYYRQQSAKRLRGEMRKLSPNGRNVAIHLVSLWNSYRGYESDSNICLYYPNLVPGAPTFSALIGEFKALMNQLPQEESNIIYGFYSSAVASNNPRVILDLLP